MSIVAKIRKIASESAAAWEQAVDTAGPEYAGGSKEKAEEMQSLADASETLYDEVIDDLEGQYEGWATDAMARLQEIESLESEGGDCSTALEAIEALQKYIDRDA